MAVLIGLDAGERHAEQHGEDQALHRALAVAVLQRVMRPGHRRARGEQDQRVEQRKVPGIERDDAGRRPAADADVVKKIAELK